MNYDIYDKKKILIILKCISCTMNNKDMVVVELVILDNWGGGVRGLTDQSEDVS